MRHACLLLVVLMQSLAAVAQQKPCIAFAPESPSATTDIYARDPLATAVTLSGDFGFYPSQHYGCWNVHVLSMPINLEGGRVIGYAISYTVTDTSGVEVGHALQFGPETTTVFEMAMRSAAADAVKDIRLAQLMKPQSPTPPTKK
jgi:hypothetical protein